MNSTWLVISQHPCCWFLCGNKLVQQVVFRYGCDCSVFLRLLSCLLEAFFSTSCVPLPLLSSRSSATFSSFLIKRTKRPFSLKAALFQLVGWFSPYSSVAVKIQNVHIRPENSKERTRHSGKTDLYAEIKSGLCATGQRTGRPGVFYNAEVRMKRRKGKAGQGRISGSGMRVL